MSKRLTAEVFETRIKNYIEEDYDRDDSYAVDIMEDMLKALRELEKEVADLKESNRILGCLI